MTKIAIIGAGLSGLTAANILKNQADISIFEKARGPGGRMSTRRSAPYFFDHGLQYFTARTAAFRRFIQPLINSDVIQCWNPRHVTFDGNLPIEHPVDHPPEHRDWQQDKPRYVGVPGMNAMAKYLAAGLDIKINTRIISLKRREQWILKDEHNSVFGDFDWVISTAPAPQTLKLLPEDFQYHEKIRDIEMRATFALMLGFSTPLLLGFEVAQIENSDIAWLAVNSHKPCRDKAFTLVVHSSQDYATTHINDNPDQVRQHLCSQTSLIIGHDVSVADHREIHSWRYAKGAKREACPLFIDPDLQLAACGDWCLGNRVEDAFTSAYNQAETLKKIIS